MRSLSALLSLFVMVAVGCQNLTPPGTTEIKVRGTYRHSPSGLEFPEEVGDFRRDVIKQYDQIGENVSVGYNHDKPSAMVAFTVFVYRPIVLESGRKASLEEQFATEREFILVRHHGGTETRSGPNGNGRGFRAEYQYEQKFAHRHQPIVSLLVLFEQDGWIIKYRVSYAASQEQESRPIVEQILQTAPWVSAVLEKDE